MLKRIILVLIIFLSVLATGYYYLAKEHKEAQDIKIDNLNFSHLRDGTYVGKYEGGMYKWRKNKIEVLVRNGKLEKIRLISSNDAGEKNIHVNKLFENIIIGQTLKVDAISGATLTTNGLLKAIDIAVNESKFKEEK